MRTRTSALGAIFATTTALAWGGQFVVGKSALGSVNAFPLTTIRYAAAALPSLIVALGPLLTALVLWRRTRVRPSRTTLALLGVALAGVALVISGGHPSSIVNGSIGWGDGHVLGGVFSFVLYGLGAAEFPNFSPLRYTALTASLGWVTVAAATAVALSSGLAALPSAHR